MGVLQSSINKILQVQIQNPGLRFSPCYFVVRMRVVALFVLDFSLNFDDYREYFVGVVVDIPVVAHVDECIPVVVVKVEDCIAVLGQWATVLLLHIPWLVKPIIVSMVSRWWRLLIILWRRLLIILLGWRIITVTIVRLWGRMLGMAYGDIVAIDAVVAVVELVVEFLVAVIVTVFQISLIFAFHYCLFSI